MLFLLQKPHGQPYHISSSRGYRRRRLWRHMDKNRKLFFFFSLSSYCSVAGRVVLPPLCTLLMSLFWWLVREEKWTVSYSLSGLPWPSEIVLNTRLVEECNSFTKLHVQGIYAWIKALRKKRKIYSFKNCWEKVNMQGVHLAIEGGGMELKHVISSTSCFKEGAEFNHP